MLSKIPRIIDFDNSVLSQKGLISAYHPRIVDLTRFSTSARLWMDKKTCRCVRSELAPEFKDAVTFLGSGDYHHITSLLLGQFSEPMNLIVFDHHPDWDVLPPKFGCGSWVSRALEQPNIKKIILIGISSWDISWPAIKSANLGGFKNNRLELYPYEHKPTRLFLRRCPDNISLGLERKFLSTVINWKQLKDMDLNDLVPQLLPRLEGRKSYVSIDKDCLNHDSARTNWEEGKMPLAQLLLLLRQIKDSLDIVGLDITGEYSPADPKGFLKSWISRLDHPIDYTAKNNSPEQIVAVNQAANMAILDALKSS